RRWLLAAVAALVITAGAIATVWIRAGVGSGRIQTIAVLPIQDISGKDSIFVTALQDGLINALLRDNLAGVASRSAVMPYAHSTKTTREIADGLHVGGVVEATVFRAGDVMRINVQFTDPQTTRALWSDTYERNVSDVLAAQSDIVTRIAAGVDGVLAGTQPTGGRK
ncbi:MAG: hypothetical protein ACRENQ_08675, partial [Gemmatimonadaceae bacterium]